MNRFSVIILLTSFFLSLQYAACIDYDGWLNLEIHHNLNCGNEKYCKRGTISIKSIRAGTSIADQIQFNKNHIAELNRLADNDGFYTMKTIVTAADNNKGTEFLSSVKAKSFLDSGLSDIINAWILPTGDVISVNFQVTNETQPLRQKAAGYKINSNFYLRYVEQAPVPDTASYIQKLEREREAREKGEVKDNRSFLSKYWMYIVPVAIFVMISGATNPDAGGQPARQ